MLKTRAGFIYIIINAFKSTRPQMKTTELVPGGAEMAVNGFNRSHYVEAYTQWYLTDSVKEQFESFRKGFMR